MPHGDDRLRRRQEAHRRDHDREAAPDPRAARTDRSRSFRRLGRAARRQQTRTCPRAGDDGLGAQRDEDRFSGVAMTTQDEERVVTQEAEEQESAYKVTLPTFHGPLDLLLHLIKKHEVDIYDIPIILITEQFSAYLDTMAELDLDVAADYIYMASLLINIKSRMLLPREEGAEEGVEDPRKEL